MFLVFSSVCLHVTEFPQLLKSLDFSQNAADMFRDTPSSPPHQVHHSRANQSRSKLNVSQFERINQSKENLHLLQKPSPPVFDPLHSLGCQSLTSHLSFLPIERMRLEISGFQQIWICIFIYADSSTLIQLPVNWFRINLILSGLTTKLTLNSSRLVLVSSNSM